VSLEHIMNEIYNPSMHKFIIAIVTAATCFGYVQ